jgi:hypothetical protein
MLNKWLSLFGNVKANKMLVTSLFSFTLLLGANNAAYAWGQNGHRVVGQIALSHLTPLAKQRVLALLSGDKIPEVSTWADEMRSNPEHFWQKESGRWHYISIDQWKQFKRDKYSKIDKPFDIYSAILSNVNVLNDSSASPADKEFHLRFLIHLIGDLHMPLHVGRTEDRGGNRIKVKFFGDETNLHSLWDTKLIESQNLSYKDFADFIDTNNKEELATIMQSTMEDWTKESYEHAQSIYDVKDGNFKWHYQYQSMPVVKQRLLKAGVRLAGVLNGIFDPESVQGQNAIKNLH